MKKKLLLLSSMIVLVVVSTGCSILESFTGTNALETTKNLVQWELDSSFLGVHSDGYMALLGENIDSVDELEQSHLELVEADTQEYLTYIGIDITTLSDDAYTRAHEIFTKLYSYSKYEVGESVKDGSVYKVDVTIYPIMNLATSISYDFYDGVVTDMFTDVTEYTEELNEQFANVMLDEIEKNINTAEYAEPVEIEIEVLEYDTYYQISQEGFNSAYSEMIKYE